PYPAAHGAADRYSADPHNADPHNADRYSAAPYSADPYSADPCSADPYGADPYTRGAHAGEPHPADRYTADRYAAGQYAAAEPPGPDEHHGPHRDGTRRMPRPSLPPLPHQGEQGPGGPDDAPDEAGGGPDAVGRRNGGRRGPRIPRKITVTRVAAMRSRQLTVQGIATVRRAANADGADKSGLTALIWAYMANFACDAALTVALANTLFFSAATGESKTKVALYLLVTLAPFAVIAPLIGPALDR